MKHQNSRLLVRAIKTFTILFFSTLLFFFLTAMKTKKMVGDLWQQLGISQFQANQNITSSFMYGELTYLGAKNAKNVAVGDRVAVINELVAYTKKYLASSEFKTEYEKTRTRRKPADPFLWNVSPDSIRNEEKARIEQQIKQTEANVNHPNEKVRNGVPYALENLKKQLKELDNPDNRIIKMKVDNLKRSNDAALKQYQDKLKKLDDELPPDPQSLLKKRLQKILDITADVDYAAELTDRGKYKVFVNPVYEGKPKEWKLAFRAGKTATDAVRKIAEDWLKQLN